MLDDFELELELACRAAVLQVAGYRRSEIVSLLGVTPVHARQAFDRVERIIPRLAREE